MNLDLDRLHAALDKKPCRQYGRTTALAHVIVGKAMTEPQKIALVAPSMDRALHSLDAVIEAAELHGVPYKRTRRDTVEILGSQIIAQSSSTDASKLSGFDDIIEDN